MILDERNEFCDATALDTNATGIARVGDAMDLTVARDIGNGEPLYCVIQITTAVTSGGGCSVEFQLASDAQEAIAVDGTASVHAKTASIAKASLVAGYTFVIPVPMESPAYERYLGILQNVTTTAISAGNINAFLTHDVSKWKAYADAIA
jgi:hypothetical protein